MSNLFDVLENCLKIIEHSADIDSALSRYPDLADELRPILKASIHARRMAVSGPSPEVMRRGRAKLLQRAAEMNKAKSPAPRRMIPVFQRLAISLTLAAIFLLSGTGLVHASSMALPGENLYPVKRTWEDMRLLFVFNKASREALENEFENERLHEVSELLNEGRDEMIQFAGKWLDVNGVYYTSGIRVMILDTTRLPQDALQNGAAVIVNGYTNRAGFVEAEEIELLPAGTTVPVGQPVEEFESEQEEHATPDSGSSANDQNNNPDENSNDNTGNDNGNEDSQNNSDGNRDDNNHSNGNGNEDSQNNSDGNRDDNNHSNGNGNEDSHNNSGGNKDDNSHGNDDSHEGGNGNRNEKSSER